MVNGTYCWLPKHPGPQLASPRGSPSLGRHWQAGHGVVRVQVKVAGRPGSDLSMPGTVNPKEPLALKQAVAQRPSSTRLWSSSQVRARRQPMLQRKARHWHPGIDGFVAKRSKIK